MMKREDVLMEALPYIQEFHGKTIVIKLGGHAMVDPVVLENAIRDAVLLHYVGIRVVLVHGGGPEISEKMKAMGKESVFVGGLRVTDQETLEIAQMVLVGKINAGIVSLIAKCGARGVGLSGSDGNLIIAKKMDIQRVDIGGVQKDVDLGHVGEIEWIDPALLNTLLDKSYIPVVAPIAIDRSRWKFEYQCRHGRRGYCDSAQSIQTHQYDRCGWCNGCEKNNGVQEAFHY